MRPARRAPNLTGLTQIAQPGTLDATGAGIVTANCPADTVVVGGNYTGEAVRTALATMNETSYSVTFSAGPASGNVVVYAVCG